MKFVFFDQCELCTDKITEILKSENISYKLESKKHNMFGQMLYDITIDTTFEHWLFIQKIAIDKLTPYMQAEKSYMLPSYNKNSKMTNICMINSPIQSPSFEIIVKTRQKKSFLKKCIDWLQGN